MNASNLMAVFIFCAVFALDQVSKNWASWWLDVSLNSAASFGLLSGVTDNLMWVVLLSFCAVILFLGRKVWLRYPFAAAMWWGGVVSNLWDRWLFGGVRDWLLVPVLNLTNNLADYLIFCSTIYLVWRCTKWSRADE